MVVDGASEAPQDREEDIMNLKTAAEILALSTSGQREYAKEIGVKRAAADTKATLAEKLLNRTLEIEREQAAHEIGKAVATAATQNTGIKHVAEGGKVSRRAPKVAQLCQACGKRRPASRKANNGVDGLCVPCYDEAGWENTHSDRNHEGYAFGDPDHFPELDDETRGVMREMQECWICHPELNEAKGEPRKGTSKLGMVIRAKGTYVHKSELVKNAVEKLGGVAKITTSENGRLTRLVAKVVSDLNRKGDVWTVIVEWNGNAFHYAGSSLNGGKFRNVSDLLRQLGV